MKSIHRIVSLVLTIFLFFGILSVNAVAAGGVMKTGVAFVNASSLRLRSGPGTDSATLDYAGRNEVVVLLGKTGNWYHVIYNLQEGYMYAAYLDGASKENAELGYGVVNGSAVNIRSGPSTAYSSLGKAYTGEKVYILGINSQWFRVIWGDNIGYIRSDYVDLTEIPYENADSPNEPLFYVLGKSTGITPSASALKGKVSAQQIITTARRYIGTPYLWGGTTPAGFDCSGFVQYVFAAHGISLPRTSSQQYTAGSAVSKSNLIPGDLVFFGSSGVSHLGIYLGNGQFIHSSSSKGVTVSSMSSSYWSARYIGARRVL